MKSTGEPKRGDPQPRRLKIVATNPQRNKKLLRCHDIDCIEGVACPSEAIICGDGDPITSESIAIIEAAILTDQINDQPTNNSP
jgi:hypothetical protein